MPIYEYYCNDCNKTYEVFKKINDESKEKCPVCKKEMKKKVSVGSFALKGDGWFSTSCRNKEKCNACKGV